MVTETDILTRIAVEKLGVGVEPEKPKKRHYTNSEKSQEHLIKHQWKKGQSGNPKGRPINPLSLTALLNKKLSENPKDAEAIVNALIALGRRGEMRAIEMSFERVDGKVAETHRIEGELPVQILFVPAQALIDRPPVEIETKPPLALEEGKEQN